MGTSSERVFNGSGKGYLPAVTIGNRTHILSERLKAGAGFKRLKKGHRPAPMPPTWTHILSYKPELLGGLFSLKRPDGRSLYRQTKRGYRPTSMPPYKPLCQRTQCRTHDPHAYLRELLSLLISASRRSPSSAVWAITKIVSLPASEPSTSGNSAASTAAAMPEAVPG